MSNVATIRLEHLGFEPGFTSTAVSGLPEGRTALSFPDELQRANPGPVIHVAPHDGDDWYGRFRPGDGDLSGMWCGPSPNHLTVIASGDAYIIPVRDPSNYFVVDIILPVCEIRRIPRTERLVVATYRDVAVYGPEGLHWIARGIAQSDIHLTSVTQEAIRGYAEGHDFRTANIPFTIAANTGVLMDVATPDGHPGGPSSPME